MYYNLCLNYLRKVIAVKEEGKGVSVVVSMVDYCTNEENMAGNDQ